MIELAVGLPPIGCDRFNADANLWEYRYGSAECARGCSECSFAAGFSVEFDLKSKNRLVETGSPG